MKQKNNKGFTLVEMLMVLTIVTLVFYISSINFMKTKDQIGLIQDVQNVAQAYETLQAKSLSLNSPTSLKLKNDGFTCFIDKEQVCNYKYKKTYEFSSNFLKDTININDDGNVLMGGTASYKYNDFEKKIVISIGSGRYEIR